MPTIAKTLAFNLFDMERAVAQKKYKTFENNIVALLDFMDQRVELASTFHTDASGNTVCTHQGLAPLNNRMSFDEKSKVYSRLAAVITAYLSDTHHTPDDSILAHFIIFKSYIANIFYLSCYANMDHILFNRNLLNENMALQLKTDQDIKYLYTCLTLNSDIKYDVALLVESSPVFGMYWYLGMLYGHHHAYNERIGMNFDKIIDSHKVIQTMTLDATSIELAAAPWMLCSYLDRDDRHEIKKSINIAIQNWLNKTQLSPGVLKKVSRYIDNTNQVKKIVVLSEQYTSPHAMYRCYHPEFKKLKEHFHVTLIAAENKYDELSCSDFHDIIEVQDTAQDIAKIISKIIKLEPDLILFPSLGMAKWTIPLANIRLAKYQMMCYGHPASAFSPFIDFSYCSQPRESWDFQQFCLEKIVPVYQGKDFIWEPHPDYQPQIDQKPHDGVVRIAINSSLPKITSRLINLCAIIKEHSTVPIEFNFFLINHDMAFEKSVLERLGPSIKVYPPSNYQSYMANLSRCDLAIGTFPFGGSNTNTDVALLGIPKIFFSEECGIASYADQTALEKLDLPDILMPKSESELLANLIYLIHDASLRNELSNNIKASNPYALFYTQKTNEEAEENCRLVSAIHWIEQNYRTLKAKTPESNLAENKLENSGKQAGNPNLDLGDHLTQIIQNKIKESKH